MTRPDDRFDDDRFDDDGPDDGTAMALFLVLAALFSLVLVLWLGLPYEPSPHLPDTLGATP